MPLNIDDKGFDEDSDEIYDVMQPRMTEMSFSRLNFDAIDVWYQLVAPMSHSNPDIWQHRLQFVWQYGERARKTCLCLCDLDNPFHRFLQNASRFTVSSMMLQAVRPEQDSVPGPPPRADNPEVLRIAVNCLKVGEELYTDPQTRKWVWMMWLQWRALVVALAGLCTIRNTPLATEAWTWVEAAYARYPGLVADTSSGMLWRPMVRLYQKASTFRDHGSSSVRPAKIKLPKQDVFSIVSETATDMDVWEANALNFIEEIAGIDLTGLGLDNMQFRAGATLMEDGEDIYNMSMFMHDQDWNWLKGGLS